MVLCFSETNNNLQISYVNGLTGAKGYSVPPNTTIFLMDSDAPQFYIKTSDRNGMCTIKAYKFEELQQDNAANMPEKLDLSKYATKEEVAEAIAAAIKQNINVAPASSAQPIKNNSLL